MKAIPFLSLLILIICLTACADKNTAENTNDDNVKDTVSILPAAADTFEAGKVIDHVTCRSDAGQSYALYIPLNGRDKTLPVIYLFDPHGDGSLPVNKYKALGDTYGFILIGSNNSKNGNDWPLTEDIWRALFNDSKSRLKINIDRIYTGGFSGGAKVAGYVALNSSEVKGVIANGAGLPDETRAADFSFSFTAIAGEGDMNMTGLVAFNGDLDRTQSRHHLILFHGIHEWAPENTMNIAFAGLQLDAMEKKLIPKNDSLISDFIKKSKERVAGYLSSNNLVKAEQECKLSTGMLEGLTDEVNWFKEKDAFLASNDVYQKQWRAQQNLFTIEQNLKTGYTQQFDRSDISYWTKTIGDLHSKAKAQSAEGAMYHRLLAYLSLAFYSLSNRLITANQDTSAQYFVDLYKITDPTNSEAWYFSAIMNTRKNKVKAGEDDLLKAVALGFRDKARMMQQPDFQKPGTHINFSTIINKMNKSESTVR